MSIIKKFSIFMIISVFAIISIPQQIQAASSIVLPENGLIVKGRTLVPLRAIFEELGAAVNWEQKSQTITAVKENKKVILKIGSKQTTVNGKTMMIDVPAQVKQGKTYVPLRFVSESLGASVKWNSIDRSASISLANKNIIVNAYSADELVVSINKQNNTIQLNGISLGMTKQEVLSTLGKPKRVDYEYEEASVYVVKDGHTNENLAVYVYFYNNQVAWISFDLSKHVTNKNWYKNLGKPFTVSNHVTYFYLEGTEQLLMFKPDEKHGYIVYADNNFYFDHDMEDKMW